MPTNDDSFPITAAMLAYAYVKPTITYTAAAGKATITDAYLPASVAESAGARGTGTAVTSDPNFTFARTMKVGTAAAPSQLVPYPTGLPGDVTSSDIVTVVEVTPTVSVPTVA
jgi:hypothetical protein